MKKIKIILFIVLINLIYGNYTYGVVLYWGYTTNTMTTSSPTTPMCYGTSTLWFTAYNGTNGCTHDQFQLEYSYDDNTWSSLYYFTDEDCNYTSCTIPVTFTQNMYIRVVEHDWGTFCSQNRYSQDIYFPVYDTPTGGTLASNQTICYNTTPALITGSAPSSNNPAITNQWQISTDNTNYTNIAYYNQNLQYPTALTTTSYFRRVTTFGSCGSPSTSNVITITVDPALNPGTISNSLSGTDICYDVSPGVINSDADATGGYGPYTYQWYICTGSTVYSLPHTFTAIGGATTDTYTPPNLTTSSIFLREATNSCGTVSSNEITFNVYSEVVAGTISTNQTICYNTIPAQLTGTPPTGGTLSGGAIPIDPVTPVFGNVHSNKTVSAASYDYQWQYSTDGGNTWNNVATNGTAKVYQPVALTQNTWYRRIDYEAGCTTYTYTNVIKITVYPAFVNGSVSSNQSICYGSQPQPLIGAAPSGATGSYTYQWQLSPDDVNWTNIAGATSLNYQPPVLTTTTYYRTLVNNCGNNYTNSVEITVSPQFIASTILPATQQICYDNTPAQLVASNSTGGMGTYNYQWQQSTDSVHWVAIGGASGQNYQPVALTQKTWYRIETVCGGCANVYSVPVSITVYPQLITGTIYSSQTICYNDQPSVLYGNTPTGGCGTFDYQWMSSPDGISWTNIIGATSATYQPPALTTTTYYERGVNTSTCTGWFFSNTITITVYTQLVPGVLSSNQSICYGTQPATITGTAATGGAPTKAYVWYQSTNGGVTWTQVVPVTTTLDFLPPVLTQTTEYERLDLSGSCGGGPTNIITITVQPKIIPGTISSNQTISHNTTPAQLTGTNATGGNGTFSYQWQYSTNDTLFVDINGATGADYQPPALTTTTYYQRLVTSNGCGPIASNTITITVFAALFPGTIGNSQVICYNTAPTGLTQLSTPIGGSGSFFYQWYSSTDKVNWNIMLNDNGTGITPPLLTNDMFYKCQVSTTISHDTAYTNIVTVLVDPELNPGNISSSQTICYGATPTDLIGTQPSGGDGNYSYQWENSGDGITYFPIISTNTLNFQPSTLTQTVYYKRITTSSLCGSLSSNVDTITVLPPLYEGSISSDQDICYNSVPDSIMGTSAMGGNGVYAYQWMSSNDSINFYDVVGATGIDYQPAAMVNTQWIMRTCVSVPTGCLRQQTNTVKITVQPKMLPGTIYKDSTVCYNVSPGVIHGSVASGGYGTYTYQWQSSINSGASWNNLPGATTQNYTCAALTQTTWYRRMAYSYQCQSSYSNIIIISVYQPLLAGTVTTDSLNVCYNTVPLALYTSNAPTGGYGNYKYQWQQSSNNVVWNDIVGATSDAYQPVNPLTQNIYYREKIIDTCNTVYSNVITVNVKGQMTVGILGYNQTIGYSHNPAEITGQASTSGISFTYQWQMSNDSINWVDIINNSQQQNYWPPALVDTTYFRRLTTNDCGVGISNMITVKVLPKLQNNFLPADTTICNGTQPDTIKAITPTGGSGTYTYQWQSSPDAITFTNILNANKSFYHPGIINQPTYYRRTVYDGGYDTSYSNIITFNLYAPLVAGSISSNQTICYNTVPAPLYTSDFPTGGNTLYSYQWAYSTNGVIWNDIIGAINNYYIPSSLTQSTWYYKKVINFCETKSTDTLKITVNSALAGGSIGSNQTIEYNKVPNELMGATPTGGLGSYTYQWQYSTNDTVFSNIITNSNTQNYQPDTLTDTTYFRRLTMDNCETDISNSVKITVVPVIIPGTISTAQTICYNTVPALLTGTIPTGGTGLYSYQWEKSPNGTSWSDILGASFQAYQPPALTDTTFFRRIDYALYCDSSYTNFIMIGVGNEVPKPVVPLYPAYCKGTNVIVNVQNPVNNYNWYDYQMNYLHSGSSHSITDIQTSQKVYVEAININNCISIYDTVRIYADSIKAGFIASADSIVVGDFIQYTSQNYSIAAVSWNWNFYDGDGSILENPYHYYNTTGNKNVFLEVTSSNGCVDSMLSNGIVYIYNNPNSINEISGVDVFNLYPNPTSDILYIDLLKINENYVVSVMDIEGTILFTENISGETKHQINFSGYADGVYMIKILSNNGIKISRIIKD
jgi:hypothetical protein